MAKIRKSIPGVDASLLIKDAARLLPDPTRRLFLRGAGSLGALTFLTGCDIIDGPAAENVLRKVSEFNDRAQALLFDRNRLAPTYTEADITQPFPFNGYYPEDEAPRSTARTTSWRSAALSTKKPHGRWTSFTRCRKYRKLRVSSASKAGARSGVGRACG